VGAPAEIVLVTGRESEHDRAMADLFDDAMAQHLEKVYRTRDVLVRRRLAQDAIAAAPGERLLDVGCGGGFYVADLIDVVGPKGSIVGVDAAPAMLAVAERRCADHRNVEFRSGDATALPVEDADFDAAYSVQVLEYVPDTARALAELHRVVKPGGRVMVWDVDWSTLSWHSDDPDRMARMMRVWDEHLTHTTLPRTLVRDMTRAGFANVSASGHAFLSAENDPETYGAALLPLIADFCRGRASTAGDEVDAWADEQRALGERGEYFFAVIQCCFTGVRP
jgi:ubiquinone/menaquinone biosynthesis C-methylase UbiE